MRTTIKIGIYLIENLINHKKYVGQSKNIYARWSGHRSDSKEKNLPLYFAIRKYGLENFKFSILEECKIEQLTDREDYWINYYNSYVPNGYNTNKAETHWATRQVPQRILDIIEDIENSTDKLIIIAKKYNISKAQINRINQGKAWRLEGKDYPLRGHEELQIEVILQMIKENFTIGEIAETFSVSVPTIKGFLKKYNVKIQDIRPTLSSSKRIKVIILETNEILHFRKKVDAGKWLEKQLNYTSTLTNCLGNIGYHLKNNKPYKGFLFQYERMEVDE